LGGGLSDIFGFHFGADFESVAIFWLCNKKWKILNISTTVVLWVLWKLRNEHCFQGVVWTGLNLVLKRCAKTVRSWMLIQTLEDGAKLEEVARALEERSARSPPLTWERTSESLVFDDDVIGSNSVSDDMLAVSELNIQVEPDGVLNVESVSNE
jgi:hypothetical protein